MQKGRHDVILSTCLIVAVLQACPQYAKGINMQEKIIFREMLSELKAYADTKNNVLNKEEIKEFFKNANLTEEQYEFIYEYLNSQKIAVEGYQKTAPEMAEAKDTEVSEEEMRQVQEEEDAFLKMYLEDLAASNIEQLSEEEELVLFNQAAGGDAMAKSRLIEQNLKNVYDLVMEYNNTQLPKSDLIQEGNVGLILVMDALKQQKTLSEYREYMKKEIIQVLDDAEQEQKDFKHDDQQIVEQVNYLNEAIKNLEEDLERKVSLEELSAYIEMPAEEIEAILKMAGDEIELTDDRHHHHEGHHHHHEGCDHGQEPEGV
ncbi:RNA polymerase sigma factor region1.1 domain-containing protein [Robinsoniella peoriensis]|uniref:RNA polymerase sigma factor region1.1 domain-containing protein n=1 Tax=Robinsoniella peoriensis TaxID=180332 RepID=UPI0010FBAEE6|nr:RNA polymerase sigma factor region1.1 domain-containing protein [Robinsoniella peoriensis]MDU7029331.1 RNA polymerase sigma factor region1.1 domain-containing protein [Clostridiales bacterium]